MTCTVGDLVDQFRFALNDVDTEDACARWDTKFIIGAIANAISKVASSRMELFSTPIEVVLEPGCVHDMCEHCDRFGGVITFIDEERGGDGCDRNYKEVTTEDRLLLKAFLDVYDCDDDEDDNEPYDPGTITFDPMNPCVFITENPVPDDREIIAIINCIDLPDVDDLDLDTELPDRICTELRFEVYELTMTQLWEIDTESTIGLERQKEHFQKFLYAAKLNIETYKAYMENSTTVQNQSEDTEE